MQKTRNFSYFNKLFFRLSTQDKVLFAKRLAILVKAGIPILDGLQMLKKQATSKTAKEVWGQVVADVENGQFLSTSLGRYKKVFGEFAVNIIQIGEMSGTLQENLNYLAEELTKKQELKRKMVGALVYPIFIMVATLAISALLTIFIFPKILPVFASFKFELPLSTRALIFVSNIFVHYGIYIFLAVIAAIVGFFAALRNERFHFMVDRFVLRIPVFGRITQSYHMANFCRTLGLLLKSQIMIVQATTITANTLSNLAYKKELLDLAGKVTKGEKISTHLAENPKLFPPMVSQMIMVGETTGNLSETLLYVSELYEHEIDMLTKNLSTTLEPVLMIVMGAIVGFIAISIITPIYEITQHLNP